MSEEQNVHVQTSICGGMHGFHSECLHFCCVSNECIQQHILPFALACGMIDGQPHIAHDTAICHNPQIHSFMEGKNKNMTYP